jgi:AraC family transcriptional regulator of adaptative response/methylated-DNA-[protein]-cysteine methyltransferase
MTPQTPDAFKPENLRYACGKSALGAIIVAQSAKGVVALFIGDDPEKLLRDLTEAFAGASLVFDPIGLTEIVVKALALVEAPHLGTDLALDLRGSPVEMAVWNALQVIPAGETRTYGALARTLPIAATAQDVGAACAANRVAIAVPCHRIVKSDGSISGYRWGVQRKRRLINKEGVA